MLRQPTGQISAHYVSSKIRNTYLRLFRPDHGPHTVYMYIRVTRKYDRFTRPKKHGRNNIVTRGVASIFQRSGHHPGIADYI